MASNVHSIESVAQEKLTKMVSDLRKRGVVKATTYFEGRVQVTLANDSVETYRTAAEAIRGLQAFLPLPRGTEQVFEVLVATGGYVMQYPYRKTSVILITAPSERLARVAAATLDSAGVILSIAPAKTP